MAMDFATKFRGYVRTATPLIKVDTFDARATMRHIPRFPPLPLAPPYRSYG